MLEINVQDCKECAAIKNLISQVDKELYRMTRAEYHNLAYLSTRCHTKLEIKRLIRYKSILNNLFWNSQYYDYDFKKIISKIKSLL